MKPTKSSLGPAWTRLTVFGDGPRSEFPPLLAGLADADIPAYESLGGMAAVFGKAKDRRALVMRGIRRGLEEGQMLSVAMRPWLAPHEAMIIEASGRGGGTGGSLAQCQPLPCCKTKGRNGLFKNTESRTSNFHASRSYCPQRQEAPQPARLDFTRVANQLPAEGNSAAFRESARRFSNVVANALYALGQRPAYETHRAPHHPHGRPVHRVLPSVAQPRGTRLGSRCFRAHGAHQ